MDAYTLVSLVGVGSYGRVYKATNNKTQATVALKIIGMRARTRKEINNLRGECEIQSKLNHPNIIRMLDAFETAEEIVVVTEFAQSDLHKLLTRERSIDEPRTQRLTYDLVSALYYLHSHRILHRDLKPQNILLDHENRAKLCDFGMARNMNIGTHVLTSIKGTPLYMAPELISEKPYDHLADFWSLGCIIYETLAGEPPFCTTSFIRLVKLIRHDTVKWPSFLTDNCIAFLKGLLEKDPTMRLTWTQILDHPFVKGNITILDEHINKSPFTHPLSVSQNVEKEKQKNNLMRPATWATKVQQRQLLYEQQQQQQQQQPHQVAPTKTKQINALAFSHDSCQAILQSDIENIETDLDDVGASLCDEPTPLNHLPTPPPPPPPCYVSGNINLIVNNFNDNFQCNNNKAADAETIAVASVKDVSNVPMNRSRGRNRDLEKRKLSQNLDNFSVRLGKSKDTTDTPLDASIEKNATMIKDKMPPSMLPGWDSCDEHHNPPIENEEWLAFLYRSMNEVLDGEIDSLKQQNLVSIIVAPLRNDKASIKVIDCVAQLLSLPLAIGFPDKDMLAIQNVYIERKLVPNLMYASKLMCRADECADSQSPDQNSTSFISAEHLTIDDIRTLLNLYELVCHLVHLDDQFLTQFCDAVAVLGTSDMLVNFLTFLSPESTSIRLANCVLALLCFTLRELPENAELVEKIIFHPNINLVTLMTHKNDLIRLRICMMLRMIGRFSCCALQNAWSKDIKQHLDRLVYDKNENVRNEALQTIDEFKHLPFCTAER